MAGAGEKRPASTCGPEAMQELFAAKHGELLAEAGGVAAEYRADVAAYAFLPDGDGAAGHAFSGAPKAARLVARDVSRMRLPEAKAHHARLLVLKAAVLRELQRKKRAKK